MLDSKSLDDVKNLLVCSVCLEDYEPEVNRPCILDCGHTICINCMRSIGQTLKKCPLCKSIMTKEEGLDYPINWAYLEIVNHIKNISSTSQINLSNPLITELEFEEGKYIGETVIINSKIYRQGKGKQVYLDGSIYDGQWKNNLRNGKGSFKYPDKSLYLGEWLDDFQDGQGTQTYAKGNYLSYSGSWKKGKFYGVGTLKLSDGTEKETIFMDGEMSFENPNFMKISSKGSTIFGFFLNEKPHSQMYKIDEQKNIYYGELDENLESEGIGSVRYSNGSTYQGQLANGKRNGIGTMVTPSNEVFEGYFVEGKLHGKGKYISQSVSYSGDFLEGRYHGEGKFKVKDTEYTGSFYNGLFNGQGQLYKNGNTYKGNFVNSKMEGQGTMIYSNGQIYEGEWKNGKRNGEGKLTIDPEKPLDEEYLKSEGSSKLDNYILGRWVDDELVESASDALKKASMKKCIIF